MFDRITDRTQVGIFFALYNENTLFPVREEVNVAGGPRGTTVVGSPVVAATVGPRLSFNGLQNPVQINLRLMSSPDSVRIPVMLTICDNTNFYVFVSFTKIVFYTYLFATHILSNKP